MSIFLSGCPATGTADWLALLVEAWGAAGEAASLPGLEVPMDWLKEHRLQLMAALIPTSYFSGVPATGALVRHGGCILFWQLRQLSACEGVRL